MYTVFNCIYCKQGNIRPHFIFAPFRHCCKLTGEFKTERIPMSQITSLWRRLCLGEFKAGWIRLQEKKGEHNVVYSAYRNCLNSVVFLL